MIIPARRNGWSPVSPSSVYMVTTVLCVAPKAVWKVVWKDPFCQKQGDKVKTTTDCQQEHM